MSNNTAPRIKVVHKNNKTYRYAVNGGRHIRLKGEPGTTEFSISLAEAMRPQNGMTIAKLVQDYEDSPYFRGLSKRTREVRKSYHNQIIRFFDDIDIKAFENPKSRKAIINFQTEKSQHPRAADYRIQSLSALLNWAKDMYRIETHHCTRIRKLYRTKNRAKIIWEISDLTKLKEHASPEVFNVALLAYHTGMRQRDLLDLRWSDIDDEAIRFIAQKTRKPVILPIHPELAEVLAAIPRKSEYVLTNTKGEPWASGFSSSWNKAVKKADIDLHFHDFRGTFVTKLATKGKMNIEDIALVMGWDEQSVKKIITRYCEVDKYLYNKMREALSK